MPTPSRAGDIRKDPRIIPEQISVEIRRQLLAPNYGLQNDAFLDGTSIMRPNHVLSRKVREGCSGRHGQNGTVVYGGTVMDRVPDRVLGLRLQSGDIKVHTLALPAGPVRRGLGGAAGAPETHPHA